MQSDHWSNYGFDTVLIRKLQAGQICDYLRAFGLPNLIVGDINSEESPHGDFVYLTGQAHGIKKHTYIPSGEDLDHVVIVPTVNRLHCQVRELTVLNKLKCSDHWAIHVVLSIN
jgi:hypothetical protein